MFRPNDKISRVKNYALSFVNNKYKSDYSDCEITVEDNGVFWVVIFSGTKNNINYPQLIIKKRSGKVISCFTQNIPKF